jgi:L-lactate dehydrogenase complex protein LldF
MELVPERFHQNVQTALADRSLKIAIDKTTLTAERKRAEVVAAFDEFQTAREYGRRIKDHVIAHLGHYLVEFERNATAAGAVVHWASTAEEGRRIVIDICKTAGVRRVTRAKSMVGEEIGLPQALADAGIERVETDLAEHIIQLFDDPPSHIVWPAMHRSREQVSVLFKQHHRVPNQEESVEDLVESARRELRDKYLTSDASITGGNFLIADTGTVCTVTNEGNLELGVIPARVHIVTTGIEKLVPSMAHCFELLRLLARSAVGAELTAYTSFFRGPRQPGDTDGPAALHIVLVDNGRTRMLNDEMREMLRCIRCGAFLNHCVVYRQIGGHAYGSIYPGPMGAVITPELVGLKRAQDLPEACTLNGHCEEVCPVKIPLPKLLLRLRAQSRRQGLQPTSVRVGLGLWAALVTRPQLYRTASAVGVWALRRLRRAGWISRLPLAGGWTRYRDMPGPARKTFMQSYAEKRKRKGKIK